MFIGHFGIGFGAKKAVPAVSLGTLFLAAQFVDLLWPVLLLLGMETVEIVAGLTAANPLDFTSYPWSHSLLMSVVWGLVLGLAHFAFRRRPRAAVVVGLLVVSHWILDLIVHRPDLPLTPWSDTRFGLGLWHSVPATLAVEIAIFAAGLGLYLSATQPVNRRGHWGLAGLVAFLLLIQVSNLFGPPPPSAEAIAWVGHAQWLLVLWGYWVDRHRQARTRPAGP